MDQLYNSFDLAYKTPFGAVKTGQEVTLAVARSMAAGRSSVCRMARVAGAEVLLSLIHI